MTCQDKNVGLDFDQYHILETIWLFICLLSMMISGKGFLMTWVFHGSTWVIGGQHARALFDKATSPSWATLIPR